MADVFFVRRRCDAEARRDGRQHAHDADTPVRDVRRRHERGDPEDHEPTRDLRDDLPLQAGLLDLDRLRSRLVRCGNLLRLGHACSLVRPGV